MFKRFVLFLCLVLLLFTPSGAQESSIRVTLLTCSPGQEVYALYGHTALRCEDTATGLDEVFNYGVFDFRKPNFTWHFVLGECDYMVMPMPWEPFLQEYRQRGSSVTAQELNLTQEEGRRLIGRLLENCRPENREYRYNFLYNNCTTMVRDMIERVVIGQVVYPNTLPHYTYREMLRQYTAGYPWAQEGNDLLLGADVDTLLTERAAMFAPEYLMRYCEDAYICAPNGDQRPLVRRTEVVIEARPQAPAEEFPLLPWQVMLLLAGVCLLMMALEYWTRRTFWLWDVLLLLAEGAVGTGLTFMLLFSLHPGVGSNWLVWLLNPVAFVGIPLVVKAALQHRTTYWFAFHGVQILSFLLFSAWIPQVFGVIVFPLALCMLTRPASYYIFCHRKKN